MNVRNSLFSEIMEKLLVSHQLYVDNLDPDLIPDVGEFYYSISM